MSDWSNEDVLNFLGCYQTEPCIWDPRDRGHKDKRKVAEAWNRLSTALNKPVKELKAKREILMVSFRKNLRRKQNSIQSAAGIDDIFKPSWFAYELMESFLQPVYSTKLNLNSKTQLKSSEIAADAIVHESEEASSDNNLSSPLTSVAAAPARSIKKRITKSKKKSPRRTASVLAKQKATTALSQLTNPPIQRPSETSRADEEDECDLYAKLLAKKIRELPKDDRKLMMYEIDGLFIPKIKLRAFSRETPSPQYFAPSTPSSVSTPQNIDDENCILPVKGLF
ncbi:unnamed protein product [Hermetia illucens]|uniref:MADF domain-containing protein n=1 Tax=Hermetia illucens TaxID=343691 RepID=A0A7R8V000_HERIL|nr:uncharacterized protein LOC119657013 [Hermetia illucens]CAD7090172.1 unnamed protein product [Hermetia illucens]